MANVFLPEGRLLGSPENRAACGSKAGLLQAMQTRQILEGQVLCCTAQHDLLVSLGECTGLIPREEAAIGIAEGRTRDIAILSRVGKPVAFLVDSVLSEEGQLRPLLSRKKAQTMTLEHLMSTLTPGDILPATVTHLEPFGAFVDIGCGVPSMIGIENISVSRIPHPSARFTVGQEIFVLVQGLEPTLGRVILSHRELLGTWMENAASLHTGMTVPGIIRGLKEYGVFIELSPNLSGLAEPNQALSEGDRVSVYIKALAPERMKVKLLIIDRLPPSTAPAPLRYFITQGHLSHWRYAPDSCAKPGPEVTFSV